jgi:transposase InsO family protein
MATSGTTWFKIEQLDATNWLAWKQRTLAILRERKLIQYVDGTKPMPIPANKASPTDDEKEAKEKWKEGDMSAQNQIILTIGKEEMVHTSRATTAKEMWDALSLIHEAKGGTSVISTLRLLFRTIAEEDTNIEEHLTDIRRLQDQLLTMQADIPDWIYGTIMLTSLPASYDAFISGFIGQNSGTAMQFPSRQMESMIRQEYRRRMPVTGGLAMAAKMQGNRHGIRGRDEIQCLNCQRKGHTKDQCWRKGGGSFGQGPKQKQIEKGKPKEQTHQVAEGSEDKFFNMAFNIMSEPDGTPTEIIAAAGAGNRTPFSRYDWVMDSGTSSHVATERSMFKTYEPYREQLDIPGGQSTVTTGRGTVELECQVGEKSYTHTLLNVLHIPSNSFCLFSESRFDLGGGGFIVYNGIRRLVNKQQKVVGEAKLTPSRLYLLSAKVNLHVERANAVEVPKPSWDEWHRRFGHVAVSSLEKLHRKGMVSGFEVDTNSSPSTCEACIASKITTRPFPKEAETRADLPGERTFSDVWGPARTRSIEGARYYISFTDDATRRTTVLFMKEKDEATENIKKYLAYVEADKKPKFLRVDNGKELINTETKKWCGTRGITIEATAPYSPSQNGVAERFNRTLMELARAMIIAKNLPPFLWTHAVNYAAYLRNRVATRALEGKTPHEAWTGQKPDVAHLREFGSSVWIKIETDIGKLSPRATKHIFVGFEDGSKAVKYYDARTRNVKVSRNFVFTDTEPAKDVEFLVSNDGLPIEGEHTAPNEANRQQEEVSNPSEENHQPTIEKDVPQPKPRRIPSSQIPRILPTRASAKDTDYRKLGNPDARAAPTRGPRPRAEPNADAAPGGMNFVFAALNGTINIEEMPRTLQQARASNESTEWEEAYQKELSQLLEKGTWVKAKLPAGRTALGSRIVFNKKTDADGNVKYKARIVVKGYSQIPGYDYTDTFAPVMRFDSLRTIMALAAVNNWEMEAIDVKGAYLNADLDEELYMTQPEGYDDGSGDVLRLVKALYGTKQAARAWYKTLKTHLTEQGAIPLDDDASVYVAKTDDHIVILAVWVDDMLIVSDSAKSLAEMKSWLRSKLEITELGEPRKLLGMEVERDRVQGTIALGQQQYIENIIKRMGLEEAHSSPTPLDNNEQLIKDAGRPDENHTKPEYATAIGMLMYAAICTRPDISFAVQTLSQFSVNPTKAHWTALKRVYRYLSGTRSFKLTYGGRDTDTELIGYTDADWASNQNDRKSISGYVYMIGGGAITWNSKKQPIVALSSAEAEYIAESHSGREALWLRRLISSLGFPQGEPTLIYADNQAAIKLSDSGQFHTRTKHIDTRFHFIRQLVEDRQIEYRYISTHFNIADLFTKALPKEKHHALTQDLGIVPS